MKRGQVKPREWILGIGVFILVIFMGTWFVSEAVRENPGFINEEQLSAYNETFNKFDEYQTETAELASNVEGITGSNTGNFGFLNDLINKAWNTLTTLRASFAFMDDALRGLSSVLGVPTFISALAISIVSVLFIMAILAVIFNRDL